MQQSINAYKGTATMEKRSRTAEIAHTDQDTQRVGVRQPASASLPQGGGYLEIYTFSELGLRPSESGSPRQKDPRLQQLREIGLSHIWQEVAAEIGYDNFIKMWRILDKHDEIKRPDGGIMAGLRAFRAQLRYQRDRFGVLVKQHTGGKAATSRIQAQMCEKVGPAHISRAEKRITIRK